MTKPCENQQRVRKELSTKHLAEYLDRPLHLLTKTMLLRVYHDEKRIDVADLFETGDHFSDVLGVAIPRVANTRSINYHDRLLVLIVFPRGKHTFNFSSFRFCARRDVEFVLTTQCVGSG